MPYVEISTNTPCHYIALDIKGDGATTWGNNNFVAYHNLRRGFMSKIY